MVERRIDTVKRKEFSLKSIQIGGGFEFSKLKFADNSVFSKLRSSLLFTKFALKHFFVWLK